MNPDDTTTRAPTFRLLSKDSERRERVLAELSGMSVRETASVFAALLDADSGELAKELFRAIRRAAVEMMRREGFSPRNREGRSLLLTSFDPFSDTDNESTSFVCIADELGWAGTADEILANWGPPPMPTIYEEFESFKEPYFESIPFPWWLTWRVCQSHERVNPSLHSRKNGDHGAVSRRMLASLHPV